MKVWSRRQLLGLLGFTSYGFSAALFTGALFSSRRATGRSLISAEPFAFDVVTVDSQGQAMHSVGSAKRLIERFGNGTILEMVAVPNGTFTVGALGTTIGRVESEKPKHFETINAFSMGRYPITQAQWHTVASFPQVKMPLNPEPSSFKGESNPVERISWAEAVEFCSRLSKHTGQNYRLPTEAEWEYVCRAGTTTSFHFGETLTPVLANYNGHATSTFEESHEAEIDEILNQKTLIAQGSGQDPKPRPKPKPRPRPRRADPNPPTNLQTSQSQQDDRFFAQQNEVVRYRQQTTPVGNFQLANAFGVSDMHGNVWEWCADQWHDNYAKIHTASGIESLDSGNPFRVMRGGAWNTSDDRCRSDSRGKGGAYDQSYFIGFRVACDLV